MIEYRATTDGITAAHLAGFFEGWPDPPSPDTHLRILHGSSEVVVAWSGDRVVGFIPAIADGALAAYVPLLEVLPAYRGRGIGRELVGRMVDRLDGYYMIDLVCDDDVVPFYEAIGWKRIAGMALRNHDRQSGRPL